MEATDEDEDEAEVGRGAATCGAVRVGMLAGGAEGEGWALDHGPAADPEDSPRP